MEVMMGPGDVKMIKTLLMMVAVVESYRFAILGIVVISALWSLRPFGARSQDSFVMMSSDDDDKFTACYRFFQKCSFSHKHDLMII
jgi:hypothetical protein